MEEHQLSTSATLDSSLHRVHTDVHQLAVSLFNIAQRLEDRLDVLAERARGDSEPQASLEKKSSLSVVGEEWPSSGEGEAVRSKNAHAQPGSRSRGPKSTTTKQDAASEHSAPARENRNLVVVRGGLDRESRGHKTVRIYSHDDADVTVKEGAPAHTQAVEFMQLETTVLDRADSQPVEMQTLLPKVASNAHQWRQAITGFKKVEVLEKPHETEEVTVKLLELDSRFEAIDKKLEQIVGAVVVRGPANENDDDEDRKRLKEKLKLAIEADRRSRVRTIVSQGEVWLEYMFGICAPDQRLGKRGSRYDLCRVLLKSMTFGIGCTQLKILFCTRLIHPRSRFVSGTLHFKSGTRVFLYNNVWSFGQDFFF
jgi:hypothetical protein